MELLGVPSEYIDTVSESTNEFLSMMTPTYSKRLCGKLTQLVKFLREDLLLCGHPMSRRLTT